MITELVTPRLHLSPPTVADVPRIVELVNDPDIAAFTLAIPYPYTEADAVTWLSILNANWRERSAFSFAIRTEEDGMVGAVGLHLSPKYGHAELGYWMGAPYRKRGYVREAVGAVIDFGFRETDLRRIQAIHHVDNPASGAVLRANRLRHEATLEDYVVRGDSVWTVEQYRILRGEWANQK